MQVLKPVEVTAAMLVSENVSETVSAWSAGTTYSVGQQALLASTQRIYTSLQGSNLNHDPATSPTWWEDVAPTNTWALFDNQVSTATTGTSDITYTLAAAYATCIALLGVVGNSVSITVRAGNGGTVVYEATEGLTGDGVSDWFEYFFLDAADARTTAVFTNLPILSTSHITFTISGSGTVSVGQCVFGSLREIGSTQYGLRAGIVDYSRKETDAFGTTTFVERAFSKRQSVPLDVAKEDIGRVHRTLTGLRATPTLWIASDDAAYEELAVVFGFLRDFSAEINYPTFTRYALEIEGLI